MPPPLTRKLAQPLSRSLVNPLSRTSRLAPSRNSIVSIQQRRSASDHADHGGHESHYDEPGGWLWGIRPGEKYEKEGWENLMWYGFAGGWVVAIAVYAGKEDTS